MGVFKGGALRLIQTVLYAINFCCAAIILGIFSYFLSVLADRNRHIQTKSKAIEGLSGAAVLYTICAVVLTCCLGGISVFAFLGILLDVLFVGAMIAIAVMTRNGANSCSGIVNTPLGRGNSADGGSWGGNGFGTGSGENLTYSVSPKTACRLNTVCFAVAIIGAFFFLITAIMQVFLLKHHKKEKRYGPGPDNNYTSGAGKKRMFWSKKPKHEKDAELGATGTAVGASTLAPTAAHDIRPSHETGYTGSTVAAPGHSNSYDKVEPNHARNASHGAHGTFGTNGLPNGVVDSHGHQGYYTQPTGTAVNPYGYENEGANRYTTGTATTATNY